MRLVSFNAQHARRRSDGRADAALMATALAALAPDVVALQEVDWGDEATGGVDQAAVVAHAIGGGGSGDAGGPASRVFAPQREGGTTGVALVARGNLDAVEVLRFVSRQGPRRGRPVGVPLLRPSRRAILLACATVDGDSLSVACAHLHLVRTVSHTQLERVVAALACRPGPHVLLGDLNRQPSWVGPTVAAAGLDLLDDDTPTHPAEAPERRIDHVASAGVRLVGHQVVTLPVSDHRAVVVDVELDPTLMGGPDAGLEGHR